MIPVLVMGRSGSGKTYSLKNFKASEIGVISVEKGRLPFKTDIKVAKLPKSFQDVKDYASLYRAKYAWLIKAIESSKCKSIAIDDSQFLLVNELFDRSAEKGYDKFTQIAANFRGLIHAINESGQEDKIVYFLHHTETDADGREKAKTVGKMLDSVLTVEGCFDIVLYCEDHKFYTQSNGQSTAKTPEGLCDLEVPNDLKMIDDAIREYYGIPREEKKEEQK